MFQFPAFALTSFVSDGIAPAGLPHSDIHGSRDICSSPWLFAACHVLLRLREPRHPPCALSHSVISFNLMTKAYSCFSPLLRSFFEIISLRLRADSFGCLHGVKLILSLCVFSLTIFLSSRFQSCHCALSKVVLGRVELPTSTLSV